MMLFGKLAIGQVPKGMVAVPAGKVKTETGTVQVKSFYMDTCEVTIADFEKFIKSTGYKTDAEKRGYSKCYGRDTVKNVTWKCNVFGKIRPKEEYKFPVIHISYNDAKAYAQWAKKRLPSNAEWMLAAASNTTRKIYNYAWVGGNSESGDVHPVGTKKPNKLGIYDLFGNVWEFVDDYYYLLDHKFNIRKGNCYLGEIETNEVEKNLYCSSSYTDFFTGFRCAKDL